jgi:UDP-glucuronate 4-epimerase
MPTQVLITGGAGFIASHLIERLLEQTDYRIVLVDNFNDYYDPRLKRRNVERFAHLSRVVVEEGDFCSYEFCRGLLGRHRPAFLLHLGAYPGVPFSLQRSDLYIQNNIQGTTALLEAARHVPVQRFLFASSSTVYGLGAAVPFVEDAPLGVPASPYGASKRAAELLGQTYHRLYQLPFTSLRLFNVYGPRLRPDLALSIFTHKILAGEPITLHGDGSVLRDFTHVGDICQGFLSALSAPSIAGECINLGHHHPIEIRTLITLIERCSGRQAVIERTPPRAGDMPFTCADLTKAQRLLGYQPQIDIEQGVAEFVDWTRQNSQAL